MNIFVVAELLLAITSACLCGVVTAAQKKTEIIGNHSGSNDNGSGAIINNCEEPRLPDRAKSNEGGEFGKDGIAKENETLGIEAGRGGSGGGVSIIINYGKGEHEYGGGRKGGRRGGGLSGGFREDGNDKTNETIDKNIGSDGCDGGAIIISSKAEEGKSGAGGGMGGESNKMKHGKGNKTIFSYSWSDGNDINAIPIIINGIRSGYKRAEADELGDESGKAYSAKKNETLGNKAGRGGASIISCGKGGHGPGGGGKVGKGGSLSGESREDAFNQKNATLGRNTGSDEGDGEAIITSDTEDGGNGNEGDGLDGESDKDRHDKESETLFSDIWGDDNDESSKDSFQKTNETLGKSTGSDDGDGSAIIISSTVESGKSGEGEGIGGETNKMRHDKGNKTLFSYSWSDGDDAIPIIINGIRSGYKEAEEDALGDESDEYYIAKKNETLGNKPETGSSGGGVSIINCGKGKHELGGGGKAEKGEGLSSEFEEDPINKKNITLDRDTGSDEGDGGPIITNDTEGGNDGEGSGLDGESDKDRQNKENKTLFSDSWGNDDDSNAIPIIIIINSTNSGYKEAEEGGLGAFIIINSAKRVHKLGGGSNGLNGGRFSDKSREDGFYKKGETLDEDTRNDEGYSGAIRTGSTAEGSKSGEGDGIGGDSNKMRHGKGNKTLFSRSWSDNDDRNAIPIIISGIRSGYKGVEKDGLGDESGEDYIAKKNKSAGNKSGRGDSGSGASIINCGKGGHGLGGGGKAGKGGEFIGKSREDGFDKRNETLGKDTGSDEGDGGAIKTSEGGNGGEVDIWGDYGDESSENSFHKNNETLSDTVAGGKSDEVGGLGGESSEAGVDKQSETLASDAGSNNGDDGTIIINSEEGGLGGGRGGGGNRDEGKSGEGGQSGDESGSNGVKCDGCRCGENTFTTINKAGPVPFPAPYPLVVSDYHVHRLPQPVGLSRIVVIPVAHRVILRTGSEKDGNGGDDGKGGRSRVRYVSGLGRNFKGERKVSIVPWEKLLQRIIRRSFQLF